MNPAPIIAVTLSTRVITPRRGARFVTVRRWGYYAIWLDLRTRWFPQ